MEVQREDFILDILYYCYQEVVVDLMEKMEFGGYGESEDLRIDILYL